jgi:hypothetical protein
MSGHPQLSRDEARVRVEQLRGHRGLFSFQSIDSLARCTIQNRSVPELGIKAGRILECLVTKPGGGAMTAAFQIMSRSLENRGVWVVVDPAMECYAPAFSGWGLDQGRLLFLKPSTAQEAGWAIEQCLRCPGVSLTWAWVDKKVSERVHRRWQLAAEVGGGIGLFFRPSSDMREPVWADSRLLITPELGGDGESRRVRIEVLYRSGGSGGIPQSWEIDHAAGVVRLVPEVANPASMERKARA